MTTRHALSTALALPALILALAACGESGETAGSAATPADTAAPPAAETPAPSPADTGATPDPREAISAGGAATAAALPRLFSIMLGLQRDMQQVSRGIWTEQHDTIAAAARRVADHPKIGPDGLQKIQGALGDDIARFRELDMNVHDLAVELETAARAGDLETVLTTEAALREGCVQCHTEFRQRLRDALGDSAGTTP